MTNPLSYNDAERFRMSVYNQMNKLFKQDHPEARQPTRKAPAKRTLAKVPAKRPRKPVSKPAGTMNWGAQQLARPSNTVDTPTLLTGVIVDWAYAAMDRLCTPREAAIAHAILAANRACT